MKVYSAPEEIKPPTFDFRDIPKSKESEKTYIQEVAEWAKKNSNDKVYAGEVYPHSTR